MTATSPVVELADVVGRAKTRRHNLAAQIAREGTEDVSSHLPACRCDLCNGRPRRRARGTAPRGGYLLSDLQTHLTNLDLAAERATKIMAEALEEG